MNILLTNDDGVNAEGINTLYSIFSEKHNVYIIAPIEEKSGSSTAITFADNLKIIHISENIYGLHGYPADCVNIGLRGEMIPKPDLVISGINNGPNLGDDVYFSGTVGGARVAYIYGISGIAISINYKGGSKYYIDAARFLLNYIAKANLFSDSTCFLNINYPDLPESKILGVKYSQLGRRKYTDKYRMTGKKNKEINMEYIKGIGISDSKTSDITEVNKGYITITPLSLDCTDYAVLQNLPAGIVPIVEIK